MNLEQLVSELKQKKLKVTPARKAILAAMLKLDKPVSAEEIGEDLAYKDRSTGKTTVYRNILKLLEQGIVKKVQFHEPKTRYELDLNNHHHHLVCVNCNKIQETDLANFEDQFAAVEAQLGAKHNFQINSHSLEFYGLCSDCRHKS